MARRPKDKQNASKDARREQGRGSSTRAAGASWFARNRDAFQFLGLFAVLMGAFYLVFYRPPSATGASFTDGIINGYLAAYATAAGAILRAVGYEAVVTGNLMTDAASGFSVQVVRGCDAMEATALFVFGVLAFPAPWRKRWTGALAGAALLAMLNLFRILTLFVVGLSSRRLFDLMHIDVWQAVFIVLTIALWLVWLRWAMRPSGPNREPEGPAEGATTAPWRSMLARVGVFLVSFLVVYGILLSVWPYASKAYSPLFRFVGQTFFSSMGDQGQARFEPLSPPVGPFDTEIVLRSRGVRGLEGVMELSSWSVGYMPTITLIALVLATPVPWRRRGIALLIGLALLIPFVALRIGLPLMLEFAREDLPMRQYQFSSWWTSVLMQAKIALVEAPASFFVVPIFIWIVATFRRSDWAGLAGGRLAQRRGASADLSR